MKIFTLLGRILFLVYPAILYFLGYLDPDESFLLILVSQLAFALRLVVWIPIALSMDYTLKKASNYTNPNGFSLVLGGLFGVFLMLFLDFLYFGILYSCFESNVNPLGENISVFDGENKALLLKSLLFNFLFFLFLEILELIKQVRSFRQKSISLTDLFLFNYPFSTLTLKKSWAMMWFLFGFAMVLFLCSARQFEFAIYFFIGFDAVWQHLLGWARN